MEDVIQAIEFWVAIFRLVRAASLVMQAIKLLLDSLANPADDKHRLAVADRLVARAIGAFVGGLAAIGDAGVVAGKALKPFALTRGEAPNTSPPLNHRLATSCAVFAGVEALGLQRMGDFAGDAHRDLAASVGVAGAVVHGPEGWSQVASVGAVVLAAEGDARLTLAWLTAAGGERADHLPVTSLKSQLGSAVLGKCQDGVFLAAVAAQRVCQAIQHIGVLRAVHHKHAVLGVLLSCAAGRFAVRLQCAGDNVACHGVVNIAAAISASQRPSDLVLDAESLALHVQPCVLGGQGSCLADIALQAMAAVGRHTGQYLDSRPFITLAIRAAVLSKV